MELEVAFAAFFGEKPNFWIFLGQYLGCYGQCEADIWGLILHLGSKYSGKNLGHSSGASYISHGGYFWNFGVSVHFWAACAPHLYPWAQFFGIVCYATQSR